MTEIEKIQSRILMRMQEVLDNEQLQKLENVLVLEFHGVEVGKKTGIHAHPHKFRRTLLTDAGNRGIPLQEIQAYAGHQKLDTMVLY